MLDPIKLGSGPPELLGTGSRPAPEGAGTGRSFAAELEQQLLPVRSVRFSAHAQERLESRGLSLSDPQLRALDKAVDAVAEKGGRETLVMLDQAALVVSVPKRTVITAMLPGEEGQNVFTNIDSAVVAAPAADSASKVTTTKGLDPLREGLGAADRLTRRATLEV